VPTYEVNHQAVAYTRQLIDARRYVIRSRWQDAQPSAKDQNTYLTSHTWDEYGAWHLGLKLGATEETKNLYAFGFGDLKRLHRSGLIACHYRAAEFGHKQIELAAHELRQLLESRSSRGIANSTAYSAAAATSMALSNSSRDRYLFERSFSIGRERRCDMRFIAAFRTSRRSPQLRRRDSAASCSKRCHSQPTPAIRYGAFRPASEGVVRQLRRPGASGSATPIADSLRGVGVS